MRTIIRAGVYSPVAFPNDTSCLVMPNGYPIGRGTLHAVIGCHGRTGASWNYAAWATNQPGYYTQYMADYAGIVTLGVDHSATNSWGDPTAMRAMDDAYNYLVNTVKMPTSKVGIIGHSMGGLTALNWALRNPGKIAGIWCISPATDLRFWRDASGAYTITYPNANGVTQGAFTTEVNNIYASSTTATASATIPALGGTGVTVTLAAGGGYAFADALTLGGAALPQGTIGAANFTYTSKDDTHLYGCVHTTTGTIAVSNGTTITAAWATQYPAYSPWERAAGYSVANGITFPIKVQQASDDAQVPPEQNNHATAGFVARAANPNITLRTPAGTGGHNGQIGPGKSVTQAEVAAFFAGLSW